MRRRSTLSFALAALAASLPIVAGPGPALAIPNPVATDPVTYAAFGRVFSDPQGCLAHDTDGDGVNDVVAPNVSPWAKGNMCMDQFLSYEEVIEGSKFLARTYPRFFQVIRLDQAYDNPNYMSAGLPRSIVIEDGNPKVLDRDRRPLYLFKATDRESPIPENERLHFVYAGAIHGPERAGAEGGIRAMEDLVTWAANFPDQPIVEAPTGAPAPTAKEALERSVVYFMLPNPDGWARGQTAPTEVEDGSPNLNYTPGFIYQRYNGNGMDLNRDWPTYGYTYRPYTPGSEPETRAYVDVLRGIRESISPNNPVGQRFAGGIDLHGQLTASAFSYTLLGSGQRDFRKNFSTVDQSLRAWADQTTRLEWSPYIGTTIAPVADQWGTVIDTIGYQITGGLGDFFDNEQIGLGAVGIDNEMTLSHIAPNSVFEPILEQMHVDGNKGLVFSQMASMLTETGFAYEPTGKIGYVFNPSRLEVESSDRPKNPGLPAQNDIDAILPCQSAANTGPAAATSCGEGVFALDGSNFTIEFDLLGPEEGIWNGGITATMTNTHVLGQSAGMLARLTLDRYDEDDATWEEVTTSIVPEVFYANAGQIATVNDPMPGTWRARVTLAGGGGPVRVKLDFNPVTAEASPGQAPISASSMDFFTDLNKYIGDDAMKAEAVAVEEIVDDPSILGGFDSLVVVNSMGDRGYLTDPFDGLGIPFEDADAYFAALKAFAEGGGNLVLTDAALRVTGETGLVDPAAVGTSQPSVASRYNGVCTASDPLEKDVCLPGTAGGTGRQAVEPTPLGYTPSGDGVPEARMNQYWVQAAAWTGAGGSSSATVGSGTGLGQMPVGQGRVVVAGSLFPDPNYAPGGPRDMRFGVASYALTFSAWQIFLNTIDYVR